MKEEIKSNCVLENKQEKCSSCCSSDWCLQIPSLRFVFYVCMYVFIFPMCSPGFQFKVNYHGFLLLFFFLPKLAPFLFFSPSLSFLLSPSFSVKHGESRTFFFHNGSFVFSEPKMKASSNVLLFYVTTEVAVTCWLLMNKYIYLASKPAYTVE